MDAAAVHENIGGPCQPVERGQALNGIYSSPENRSFLLGTDGLPDHRSTLLGILAIFTAIFAFAYFRDGDNLAPGAAQPYVLMLLMVYAVAGVLYFFVLRRRRYWMRHGVLFVGTVVDAEGKGVWTSNGSVPFPTSREYRVTVNYRVRLPDGRVLAGTSSRPRADLSKMGPPAPGTPVAVLVVPESGRTLLL